VANYATLKRSGRNYTCCCPFHAEKTPSFHINVDEGFYKCFGCGESGDVFSFIMKIENLSFMESLELLAKRANLEMPSWNKHSKDSESSKERSTILSINREAGRYFYKQLSSCKNAIDYIKNVRRLSPNVALKTYYMGYAPNSWCNLTNYLRSLGFRDDDIVKSGLAKVNNNGLLYDFFRNRIIVPILDTRGNFIAFGGRSLDNETTPKYLNSPDTPVFKKSENLFSLNLAKKEISSSRSIILAEGYMDVIALYQGGFKNAVASLGTSLTPEQVNIIKRYADEIIICYDSDNAGINATNRAIGLLLNASTDKDLKIKVLQVQNAKDPDEYIKNFGSENFKWLLDNSIDAIDFQLNQVSSKLNIHTNSGKIELVKHSANILAQIPNKSIREVYISSIAKQCNIEPSTFVETVNGIIAKNNKQPIRQYSQQKSFPKHNSVQPFGNYSRGDTLNTINHYNDRSSIRIFEAERWIIAYIATMFYLIPYAQENLTCNDFVFGSHQTLFKTLCEHSESLNDLMDISILHSDLSEEHFNNLLDICNRYKSLITDEDVARWVLMDCIDRLKEPKVPVVDGKIDLRELKNKKLNEERLKHKNIT
jgi:DNA primase